MTTPERLRRRQIREFIALVILGVLVVSSTLYDAHKRDEQASAFQNCISSVVHDLTTTLDARAALTDPRAQSVSDLISDLLAAKGNQAKGRAAVARYEATQTRLAALTKNHPIPPFPNGKCSA